MIPRSTLLGIALACFAVFIAGVILFAHANHL
jgi:hypothetical protein